MTRRPRQSSFRPVPARQGASGGRPRQYSLRPVPARQGASGGRPSGRRFVVGLTGGLAAGKSSALEAFRRAGAGTVSLDGIAHDLSKPGRPGWRAVVRAFGKGILDRSGRLDRSRLAGVVFRVPKERKKLENVLHPLIRREMRRLISRMQDVVVVDVPLLFEKGERSLARGMDATVLVAAPRTARLRRALARGMTRSQALSRMAAQLPDGVKSGLADIVVHNAGSRKEFQRRIAGYHRAFELIRRSARTQRAGTRRRGR